MANKPVRYIPGSRGEGLHLLAQNHEIYRIRRYPVNTEKVRALQSLFLIAILTGSMAWLGYAHRRQSALDAALFDAVKWNSPEKVQSLLTQGANPDLKWRDQASFDLQDFYKPLIGTDPRQSDAGRTPLMLAAAEGKTAIVRALLTAHANTTLRDGQGHTALYWAEHGQGKENTAILHLLQQRKPRHEAPPAGASHLAERSSPRSHPRE